MAKERVNLPRQRIETLDIASHKNFFKHCRDSTKSKNALYRRSSGQTVQLLSIAFAAAISKNGTYNPMGIVGIA
jgi:hypothetical protein